MSENTEDLDLDYVLKQLKRMLKKKQEIFKELNSLMKPLEEKVKGELLDLASSKEPVDLVLIYRKASKPNVVHVHCFGNHLTLRTFYEMLQASIEED